jgi:hypothetical protein
VLCDVGRLKQKVKHPTSRSNSSNHLRRINLPPDAVHFVIHCVNFLPRYLAFKRYYWRLLAHWYWTNTAGAGNEGGAVLPKAKKRCQNAVARD